MHTLTSDFARKSYARYNVTRDQSASLATGYTSGKSSLSYFLNLKNEATIHLINACSWTAIPANDTKHAVFYKLRRQRFHQVTVDSVPYKNWKVLLTLKNNRRMTDIFQVVRFNIFNTNAQSDAAVNAKILQTIIRWLCGWVREKVSTWYSTNHANLKPHLIIYEQHPP